MGACLEWVNTIDDACDKRYLEEYAHGEYCHEQSFKWGFQEGVDWLEKQGEKVTAIEGFETEFERQVSGLIASAINKEHEYNQGYVKWTANALLNYAKHEIEKQGEQKPVELEKEEKSRLMKKCVHRAYQQGYDTGFFMATTELEHKQEWSDEDEKIRSSIIDFIRYELNHSSYIGTAGVDSARQIEWLKSLKDRVQPEQEWSEEDEKFLGYAIKAVHNMYVGKDKSSTTDIYIKTTNWLNSLNPQNRWKPSEEQMDALHYVTNFDYGGHKSTLVSLYEQLKKLK